MQKTKTLPDIGGRPVTVYEVRVREVLELLSTPDKELAEAAQELLPKCISLTQEELLDLYPSEMDEVWAAFEEVNDSFFSKLRAAGIIEQLAETGKMLAKSFCEQFAAQCKQDMLRSSITAGAPLSSPAKK